MGDASKPMSEISPLVNNPQSDQIKTKLTNPEI